MEYGGMGWKLPEHAPHELVSEGMTARSDISRVKTNNALI
jgi:hypothetical protein